MRLVVTGGAGFIGANLCRRLAADPDHTVTVLDDLSTGRRENLDGVAVDLMVGDVLDRQAVQDACRDADSIIHLAAVPSVPRSIIDPRRSHDVNVDGTVNVLEAARPSGTQVIVASSSSVYGRNPVRPQSEDLCCIPLSPYAAGKLSAESYAHAYRAVMGVPGVAYRFFNVFGPLQAPDHPYAAVIPRFISAALRGAPLTVHGDGCQSRDFTYVDNVVEVLERTAVEGVSVDGPVNLAFGTNTTVNRLTEVLGSLTGRSLDVRREDPRPGDVQHSQASTSRLRQLFPMCVPADLEDALRETIAWIDREIAPLAPPVRGSV